MIYSIFKDKVIKYPSASAFVLEDGQPISYGEADILIEDIADQLRAMGVNQGDRIGAMFEFESLHPFVFYALDKLNASYVPFDVNTPKNQLEMDIEKLGLKAFLKDSDIHFRLAKKVENNTKELPIFSRDESIPVYIVSSSGTSGNKKWMGLEGAGLRYWEKTEEEQLELKHGHKVLCTRSPAYDARISEYLRALIAGGTLYLISRHERKDMDFIIQYCAKQNITEILLIASQLTGDDLENKISKMTSLKNLIVTGDACSPRLQELCIKYRINLINAYGPTEALFGISILNVNNLSLMNEHGKTVVPIGFPAGDDIKVHIVNGRLYIESPYLIKGYIDDPEKTALFFPEIVIDGKPTRVFDTGDCFEIKNGMLLFKGRHEASNDSKIIGVKVDSLGVEQLISEYLGIPQACVVSKTIAERTKLVAYLVVKPEFDAMKFVEYLQGWLKAEEMPLLIKIDTLPIMTVSNKIDRKALRERVDQPSEYFSISPQNASNKYNNDITKKLENIWVGLFNAKPDNHDVNFTFQGGDSLYAMRLLKKIQAEIDPDFSHRDLFTLEPITINSIYEKIINRKGVATEPMALISPLTHPEKPGRPILWMLPPLLGDSKYSLPKLAESFAENHNYNVYGLSEPGIYDMNMVPKSMDEAVERYVKAILSVQKSGHYSLMGFSYGCILAHRVVLALQKMGHRVVTLHLVDGFSPLFYQRLSLAQHAALMNEFAGFITKILNNGFYKEDLEKAYLNVSDEASKQSQINSLVDYFKCRTKNAHSKSMLEVVRAHLTFILAEPPPEKTHLYMTRYYLSKSDQNYVSMIDDIPGIVKKEPDYTFYFWNRYFDQIRRCNSIADCDHLGLIEKKSNTQLFFSYSPVMVKFLPRLNEWPTLDEPIYLSTNQQGGYSLAVCNLNLGNAQFYNYKLLENKLAESPEIIHYETKYYKTNKPDDTFYRERYAIIARISKKHKNQCLKSLQDVLKYEHPVFHVNKYPAHHDSVINTKSGPATACKVMIQILPETGKHCEFTLETIFINQELLESLMKSKYGPQIKLIARDETLIISVSVFQRPNVEISDDIKNCFYSLLPLLLPSRHYVVQNEAIQVTTESLSLILDEFNQGTQSSTKKCSIM